MKHMDTQTEQIAAVWLLILIVVMIAFVAQDSEKIAYEHAMKSIEGR